MTINNYFLTIRGNNEVLIKSVNDTLESYIKNSLINIVDMEGDQTSRYESLSIDSLCGLIADMHKSQVADYPDAASNQWFIETYSETTFHNPNILSVQFSEATYLGGAHPNTFTNFLNFEKSTGKTLGFDDIIKDKTGFLKIAESAFRKYQELGIGDDLEEAGYFFEKGIFALPYILLSTKMEYMYSSIPMERALMHWDRLHLRFLMEVKDVLDLSKVR